MRKFYSSTLFLLFFLMCTNVHANFNLKVLNPDAQWNSDQGTIEEASIVVKPHGIYSQIDLYLTISDREAEIYSNPDQLEIVLDFDLPEEAFIIDSWLWIGEDIVQGELWDRLTATLVYESIVSRNQDPSVLYKDSATEYQLRIFPLIPGEERKVKISYMILGEWTNENVAVSLPIEILKTSALPVPEAELIVFAKDNWENPSILGSSLNFMPSTTSDGQFVQTATLSNPNAFNTLDLAWDSPLNNGVYASKFEVEGESIYELVVMPNALLNFDENTIQGMAGSTSVFDFYTDLADGFTYARYHIGASQLLHLNKPIVQVGKYFGTFPLTVELTGILESQPFAESISITEENIIEMDQHSQMVWSAQYLKSLEALPATDEQVLDIIDFSKDNRILSLYTTFICLEPSQGGEICQNCVDDSNIETPVTTLIDPGPDPGGEFYTIDSNAEDFFAFTGVEGAELELNFTAYPNPFENQLTMELRDIEDLLVIEIYNTQGQLIRTFIPTDFRNGRLVWNALDVNGSKIGEGFYLLRVVSQNGVQAFKVLKQ